MILGLLAQFDLRCACCSKSKFAIKHVSDNEFDGL